MATLNNSTNTSAAVCRKYIINEFHNGLILSCGAVYVLISMSMCLFMVNGPTNEETN